MSKRYKSRLKRVTAQQGKPQPNTSDESAETKPDWEGTCCNCGQSPIVPVTGMCGPCTFGEADTAAGNW